MPFDTIGFLVKLLIGSTGALAIVFLRLIGAMPRPWFDADIVDRKDELDEGRADVGSQRNLGRNKDVDSDAVCRYCYF